MAAVDQTSFAVETKVVFRRLYIRKAQRLWKERLRVLVLACVYVRWWYAEGEWEVEVEVERKDLKHVTGWSQRTYLFLSCRVC